MSQVTVNEKPIITQIAGLNQSVTPTAPVPGVVFFTSGLLERDGTIQRLPGKLAVRKFGDNCFDINFLPNGDGAYFHVKGTGLVFWDKEELEQNV